MVKQWRLFVNIYHKIETIILNCGSGNKEIDIKTLKQYAIEWKEVSCE